MRRLSRALSLIAAGGAGCSTGPSHVPPLWQVPGAAVSSAVANAAYGARRDEVKRLVALHERALAAQMDGASGPWFDRIADTARVPAGRRPSLLSDLISGPGIYRREDDRNRLDIEAVTVAFMVYSD